jgi:chromosomal replication initiator protein DnaA
LSAESTLWNQCTRVLQAELPEQQFNTWIRPLQAVDEGSVLRLLAPNRFVVDWVQQHHLERILQVVDDTDSDTEVVVEVGSREPAAPVAPAIRPNRPVGAPIRATSRTPVVSRLNPQFTFASFVEGKSNQLAKAAATQVGENPGKSYNPLFIYGGVGLGKTHLMHAIGNSMIKNNPEARVSYVHSERFVGDMVRGLQRSTTRFRNSKGRIGHLMRYLLMIFSFLPARSDHRKSFFIPSTPCWRDSGRLSSPAIVIRKRLTGSRKGSSLALAGASPWRSSRQNWKPPSQF